MSRYNRSWQAAAHRGSRKHCPRREHAGERAGRAKARAPTPGRLPEMGVDVEAHQESAAGVLRRVDPRSASSAREPAPAILSAMGLAGRRQCARESARLRVPSSSHRSRRESVRGDRIGHVRSLPRCSMTTRRSWRACRGAISGVPGMQEDVAMSGSSAEEGRSTTTARSSADAASVLRE